MRERTRGRRWAHVAGACEGKSLESMRKTSSLRAQAVRFPLQLLGELHKEVACVWPVSLWLPSEGQGAQCADSALVQVQEGEGRRE